jgi:hypothetical protein
MHMTFFVIVCRHRAAIASLLSLSLWIFGLGLPNAAAEWEAPENQKASAASYFLKGDPQVTVVAACSPNCIRGIRASRQNYFATKNAGTASGGASKFIQEDDPTAPPRIGSKGRIRAPRAQKEESLRDDPSLLGKYASCKPDCKKAKKGP